MEEGGIAQDGHYAHRRLGPVEDGLRAVAHAEGGAHANGGIHGVEGFGAAQGIAADIAGDHHIFAAPYLIEEAAVGAAGAQGGRTAHHQGAVIIRRGQRLAVKTAAQYVGSQLVPAGEQLLADGGEAQLAQGIF